LFCEANWSQLTGAHRRRLADGWDDKGNVGVTGHNASKRLRDHHYTTLSHVNSWAPIDGGPWRPGSLNLSMNVWERTPLDLEFLEEYSMPISPAYLAEVAFLCLILKIDLNTVILPAALPAV
jgi:hypothetical protein